MIENSASIQYQNDLLSRMIKLLNTPELFTTFLRNTSVNESRNCRISIWQPEGFTTVEFEFDRIQVGRARRKRGFTHIVLDDSRQQADSIIQLETGQIYIHTLNYIEMKKTVDYFMLVRKLRK